MPTFSQMKYHRWWLDIILVVYLLITLALTFIFAKQHFILERIRSPVWTFIVIQTTVSMLFIMSILILTTWKPSLDPVRRPTNIAIAIVLLSSKPNSPRWQVKAQLDTGSSTNLMSRQLASKLYLSIDSSSRNDWIVSGREGLCPVFGTAVLNVTFPGSLAQEAEFHIVDNKYLSHQLKGIICGAKLIASLVADNRSLVSFNETKQLFHQVRMYGSSHSNLWYYNRDHTEAWAHCVELWGNEFRHSMPWEVRRHMIQILDTCGQSWMERLKSMLEDTSGTQWIWYPLRRPLKKASAGYVYLQWTSARYASFLPLPDPLGLFARLLPGRTRTVIVSNRIAGLLLILKSRTLSEDILVPEETLAVGQEYPPAREGLLGNRTKVTSSSTKGQSSEPQSVAQPGRSELAPLRPSNQPQRRPVHSANGNTVSTKSMFALVCVKAWGKLRSDSIELRFSKSDDITVCCTTDAEFEKKLRERYRRLVGFWVYWFSPHQFAFCDASKFEKFSRQRLTWKKNEFPDVADADYEFRPRPAMDPYEAPLGREEWQERFYSELDDGLQEGEIGLIIPTRRKRFQLDTHTKREELWGLYARREPHFVTVVAWMVLILLGGMTFTIWWLSKHGNQWTQAFVPLTAMVGIFNIFWGIVSEKYKLRPE